MCPTEGGVSPGSGASGDYGPGATGGGNDISAILAYINHRSFGSDGDYTGNAGYSGDNTGPVGSKAPRQDDDLSQHLLDNIIATWKQRPTAWPPHGSYRHPPPRDVEPYGGRPAPAGRLFDFAGADVDAYTGMPITLDDPDPFTGLPVDDPFLPPSQPARTAQTLAPGTLRAPSLLKSPNLLAENDVRACDPNRTSCPTVMKSDFNQSSEHNRIQAELDQSYTTILDLTEKKTRIIGHPPANMQEIASRAAAIARSDDYQLAYNINLLRYHPLEVRHFPIITGLGHMAAGGFVMLGSGLIIYGSGGLALPLLPLMGGMGFGAGAAEVASGFALMLSGANSADTQRMSGQLDYIFTLSKSPTSLVFGTTGLVVSGGDVDVSHRFALAGGIAEDLSTFRGDPSKLYSAVIPGVGTKAEKGASTLLMKDVTALGYRAPAHNLEQVAANLNRNFTVEELKGIDAFRQELATSGRLDLAGSAGHTAAGAAGSGGGADYLRHGAFIQELKLHGPYTPVTPWLLNKASTQSLNYSIKYQLETRARGEQLILIRSTKHIWISPTEAVRYVGQ